MSAAESVNEPLVSVVLTTYNRRSILPRALESLLNGTYQNFEIVIIDDASSDGTQEYGQSLRDPRIRYIRMPENGGVLRARNRGFNEVRGNIVAILDDDDELVPEALDTVVREFARTESAGVELLWFDCVDVESGQVSGVMPRKNGPLAFADYLRGDIHGDFWLVFRRSAIADYRFDERLKAHESLLWLRIHRTHKAWHVPAMLCKKYRQHGLPRLCDVDVRVDQLPHTTLAMQQFVQEFGTDLAALAPRVLGGKLAYLGLHQMAIADFSSGRASILRSLHYRFSLKYLMLYCASFFLGTRTVIAMIRRIESRALAA